MNRSSILPVVALLLAAMLSACATAQNNHDPIEPVNRVTDKVNDSIDRISLKPVAQGYTAAVPKPVRTAVSNFYDNATYTNTILNDFLQGKGQQGIMDIIRFLINSSLGVAGLVDVATSMGFEKHEEDFGQTLAVWGFSQGAYIVYPLAGPNSVRQTPDFLTSTATDPLFWASLVLAPYITIPVATLKYVDKRARLMEASDMRDELALDPYVFTREAYTQNRLYRIYDGNPPASETNDDDWEEEDFDAEDDKTGDEFRPKTKIRLDSAAPAEIGPNQPAIPVPDTEIRPQSAPPQSSDSLKEAEVNNHSSNLPDTQGKMYVIYLSSHYSEVEAAAEQGRISKLGIKSEIYPVSINNRTWYRLRGSKYASLAEARAHLDKLRSYSDLASAWIETTNEYSRRK
jgi:phospholipid-binding lipoprotein MlaA